MKWPGDQTLTATCAGGAEPYLEQELRAFGLRPLVRENGAVYFSGSLSEIVTANYQLRTASRILLPLISGTADSYDDLYRLARTLDWASLIDPEQSLRVSAVTRSRALADSSFAAVRVKDAITDSQRARARKRSSVSRRAPDVTVTVYVSDRQAQISLDGSGRPLHQRGYRTEAGPAPLRETLAATVLQASGWHPGIPLIDPFCGSGTIAIEAALVAARVPPGRLRSRFAYQQWRFVDRSRVHKIESQRTTPATATDADRISITASDASEEAVTVARRNAERAGVSHLISFRVADATQISDTRAGGFVVTNPPYGERLDGHDPDELMRAFGRAAKQGLPGWSIFFLSEGRRGAKSIGLRTRLIAELWNGGIQVNLYGTDIYTQRPRQADATAKNQ